MVYLSVTLDRTLSYKTRLSKTAGKLKTRNNLLSKLAGTTRRAGAHTLRTSPGLVLFHGGMWQNSAVKCGPDLASRTRSTPS